VIKASKSRSKSKEIKSSKISNNKNKVKNIKQKNPTKSPNKYKNIATDKSYESKKNISNHSNYLDEDYLNEMESHKKDSYYRYFFLYLVKKTKSRTPMIIC
jgi:hypothetical protein